MKHRYMALALALIFATPMTALAAPQPTPAGAQTGAGKLGQPEGAARPQGTVAPGVTTDGRSPAASGQGKVLAAGERINLNTATFEQIEMLPNIGPKLAQAIIDWRTQNGPFKQPEDLMKVSGIRAGRYAKVQAMIYVDDKHAQAGKDPGITNAVQPQ